MRQRGQTPGWIVALAAGAVALIAIVAEETSNSPSEDRGGQLVRVGDPPLRVAVEEVAGDHGLATAPLRVVSYEPERLVESLSGALDEAPSLDRLGRLVESMRAISVSVERACPPPALLACRPGLRVAARLGDASPRPALRRVGAIVRAGLRHAGFRNLRVRSSADGSGVVRSGKESVDVAEWRVDGTTLQLAVGGLDIDATILAPPPLRGRRADSVPPRTRVRIDTPSLAALLPYDITALR